MKHQKGSQKAYLLGLANALKPVVQIGKNGLTPELIDAISQALDAHELIKIKFMEFKEEKKTLSKLIGEQTQADLIGMIGNVAIYYKQNPNPEKKKDPHCLINTGFSKPLTACGWPCTLGSRTSGRRHR